MHILPAVSSSGLDGLALLTKQSKKNTTSSALKDSFYQLFTSPSHPVPQKENHSCFGPLGPAAGAGQHWERAGAEPLGTSPCPCHRAGEIRPGALPSARALAG